MANLNDLINLAKADGGKFFVIDEQGDPKLVIMGIEDYERILLGKIAQQAEDVEEINREILRAQMLEKTDVSSSPIIQTISPNDLREEVIDTSFDFEGPKVEIDDL
jgi:hypothetical protein